MLYISLGQSHNVLPRDKLALYNEWGIGGIIRMRTKACVLKGSG